MSKVYLVYIMANRKYGALYTGFTGDPVVRIWQHKNEWFDGFTKDHGIKKLVWYEVDGDAEAAIIREKRLKNWHRDWKIKLIEARNPDWRDLYPEITGEQWNAARPQDGPRPTPG